MKENVGHFDQMLRSIAGPSLAILGYRKLGGWRGDLIGLTVMTAGALISETALTRVCPVNAVLGINTIRPRSRAIEKEVEREIQSVQ